MLLILTNLETNEKIEFAAYSEYQFEEYYLDLFDYEYLEKYEGDFDDLIKLELEIEGINYLIPQGAFEPGNFFLMLNNLKDKKFYGEIWRFLVENFDMEEIVSMYGEIEDITFYQNTIEEVFEILEEQGEIDPEKLELFTTDQLVREILNHGNQKKFYYEFEDGVIEWNGVKL